MLSVCCLSICLSVLSVCDVGVLWPNGWMDQGETWHRGRHWPRPHCVRWGPSSPNRAQPPIFGPCVLWPNGRPSQVLLGTCLPLNCPFTCGHLDPMLNVRKHLPCLQTLLRWKVSICRRRHCRPHNIIKSFAFHTTLFPIFSLPHFFQPCSLVPINTLRHFLQPLIQRAHLTHGFLGQPSPRHKPHLERFSRFRIAHQRTSL